MSSERLAARVDELLTSGACLTAGEAIALAVSEAHASRAAYSYAPSAGR